MSSKALVLTLAGMGCLAAAAGAAYWAPRHTTPAPIAASAPAPAVLPDGHTATPASAPISPSKPLDAPAHQAADTTEPALEHADAAAKPIDDTPQRSIAPESATTVAAPLPTSSAAPPPVVSMTGPTPAPLPINEAPPPAADPQPVVQPPVRGTITVEEDSVIGIRLDQTITTETARVEDRVTARVTRDVRVDGRTAIPEGATLEGNVTLVERGGRFHDNARLGVKFTTLVLADRTRVPLVTDTIYRVGESASNEATAKIGASAVVGAILGAVVGGKRGAAIGGSAGAAGGAAAVAAGGPNDAVLPAGMPLTVRLSQPVTFEIDRN